MTPVDFLHKFSRSRPVAGVILTVTLIMAIHAAVSSMSALAAPPRTGWMENFEPVAEEKPVKSGVLVDQSGRRHSLEDYRGKLVLVNFWATWCGPCVREMPSLKRLQIALAEESFTVLALSQDLKGWPKILPFRKKHKLEDLPILHDTGSKLMFGAGVKGLPTTLLIGRDGKELGRLVGPAEWDSPEAIALLRYYLDRR